MDWNQELLNSALWLARTYAVTLVAFVVVMGVLARTTVWGRQFWALSGAWFWPSKAELGGRARQWRDWKPLMGVALILFFVLLTVRMNVLFSFWYNGFYTALQGLDQPAFWTHMHLFALLASLHVVRALVNAWIRSAFSMTWRLAAIISTLNFFNTPISSSFSASSPS